MLFFARKRRKKKKRVRVTRVKVVSLEKALKVLVVVSLRPLTITPLGKKVQATWTLKRLLLARLLKRRCAKR